MAKAMTVSELREALKGVSDSLIVVLEGCDCAGDAGGVLVYNDYVYLQRLDSIEMGNSRTDTT